MVRIRLEWFDDRNIASGEIFDVLDITDKITSLRRSISGKELEKLEFECVLLKTSVNIPCLLFGDPSKTFLDENIFEDLLSIIDDYGAILFEGMIYEVETEQKGGDVVRSNIMAYSDLILYDRHVVYKVYDTGTKAGAIIKDLAGLVSGVDVSNVDEDNTPALNSPWTIENETALKIMQSIAKGTNYWLRMKPGKILYFKPKAIGSYAATIDSSKIISAEYSEDRWRLKNRVIYVGANGQVLADVSEGAGDLPVVVHDPFLTDPAEALRRANIRLALNKEYGKQLRVEMHQDDFEAMNVDLGDTIRVNLPSLGLENADMYLVEIEYDPRRMRYTLTLGGRLELFEEFFEEAVGGDVAARFGRKVSVAEKIGSVSLQLENLRSRVDVGAIPLLNVLVIRPPIPYRNASNVFQDVDGRLRLISGATSGSVEIPIRPIGCSKDTKLNRIIFDVDPGQGSFSVSVKTANKTIASNISSPYVFKYLPPRFALAEKDSSSWGATAGAVIQDSTMAMQSRFSLKCSHTSSFQVWYPSGRNWGLNASECQYFAFWIYCNADATIYVRLATDDNNYYRANTTAKAGKWVKNVIPLSSFQIIGSPSWNNINYILFEFPAGTFYIDFDYCFFPWLDEDIWLEVQMSRPNPSAASPCLTYICLEYQDWGREI